MRRLAILAAALCLTLPHSAAVAQFTRVAVVTDGSGTVATGGASQPVFGINPDRNYLYCQNPISATETLFINYGAPAGPTNGSVELAPGGSINFLGASVPTTAINVTAATNGHRFICKQGGNQ